MRIYTNIYTQYLGVNDMERGKKRRDSDGSGAHMECGTCSYMPRANERKFIYI